MKVAIVSNASFTDVALGTIANARHDLFIIQYLFSNEEHEGNPVHRIATAIREAAERNVYCRILLNRFSHGRAGTQRHAGPPAILKHRFIDLRYHTSGQVLHSKILIADDEEILCGSHNLSHWTLTRSHNISVHFLDQQAAQVLLSIYEPLFRAADNATL